MQRQKIQREMVAPSPAAVGEADRQIPVSPANRSDHGCGQPEVALHPLRAKVEPAVAQPQGLVDVLLVELERERLRARDHLKPVDLDLDLAGGDVRIHRLGGTAHDLTVSLEDELRADVVRGRRRVGRPLRIDDELDCAGVVAEVDEDEPAVVASPGDPAGDGDAAPGVLRAGLAAVEIAPGGHPVIRSTSASSGVVQSGFPCSRTVALVPSTITVQPAPSRPACVIWPFCERAA